MRKRIFAGLMAIALLTGVLYTSLVSGVLPSNARAAVLKDLREEATTLARSYPKEGFSLLQLQNLLTAHRVTWIKADGEVLFDSREEPAGMPNHLDRPEVAQAIAEGSGSAVRYSQTLETELIYYVLRLNDGSLLRLSASTGATKALLQALLPWLQGGLVLSILLSYALAGLLSHRITRSIDGIDLDKPEDAITFEELTPMLSRIQQQNVRSARQVAALKEKQQQMDALLNSMSEGFVVLDSLHRVTTINQSAAHMLRTDASASLGKSLTEISRKPEIIRMLEDLDASGIASATLQANNQSLLVSANTVHSTKRAVVLVQDVTEKREGETMRKRFTANVSHELRTPLTAISGYSEMLASGMVKHEDEKEFLLRIAAESNRMLALVEDILRLSKLDEGYPGGQHKQVNLYKVAKEEMDALESAAQSKKVSLHLSGDKADIKGDKTLLGEMISNLLDNAIKYNREGGQVDIVIKNSKAAVTLSVTDTGIGIAPSQQDKIFERFYRTDSSRSKETGGTGLGLSIVKHAAEFHHATLQVNSYPGKGTSISVTFSKDKG